jgi:hypothetical protein
MVDYFSNYSNGKIGVAMGVNNLLDVFDEDFYELLQEESLKPLVNSSKRNACIPLPIQGYNNRRVIKL